MQSDTNATKLKTKAPEPKWMQMMYWRFQIMIVQLLEEFYFSLMAMAMYIFNV